MKHKHKKEERPKQRRGRFPHEVDTLLQAQGLATEGFLFCAAGDMDQEGNYCQAWLSFDRKGLYLATGEEHIERKKFAKKPFSRSYTLRELRCFPLEEFDSLQVERYATTGQLIGKKGGDDYPLLRFSIGVTAKIQPFCDCFNALREGKALEPFLAQLDEALYCPKCGERYPDYRRVCPKCIKKRTVALRLFGFFGGYKKQVGLILLLTAIFTAFTVLLPKVSTELLFDNVLNADNPSALSVRLHALGWLIAAIIGMRLLEIGLKIISDYIIAGICPRVLYDIKKKIFGAMQKLSVGFYSSKQTGQLMDRVTSDANHIYWFFVDGLPFIVINILTLCGVIAMMLLTSWRLTLTVLLVIPLVLLLAAMGDRLFRRLHHRKWAAQARLRSTLSDNINGQRII
ncbi:MAG: hypothetical protein LBQ33_01565, partial [Oscillospiraceae bacterium]|nr:hypothetical protein [Oscillospiraceae bacterium]